MYNSSKQELIVNHLNKYGVVTWSQIRKCYSSDTQTRQVINTLVGQKHMMPDYERGGGIFVPYKPK